MSKRLTRRLLGLFDYLVDSMAAAKARQTARTEWWEVVRSGARRPAG